MSKYILMGLLILCAIAFGATLGELKAFRTIFGKDDDDDESQD